MAPPAHRPVICPVLIGRTNQLESLEHALEDATRGRGQIVTRAGDAGIGKSRLVTASKATADRIGYLILECSCFEPDRTLPCAPLMELVRTLLREQRFDGLAQVLGPAAPSLMRLVPELGVRLPELTSTLAPDPEQERLHLFHALVELMTGLARTGPVLLIV